MRILLLEDDHTLLLMWKDLLSDEGHEVLSTSSLAEATKIVRFEKFDLIISDLLLDEEVSLPFLQTAKYINPDVRMILATGSGWFGCGELTKIAPTIDFTLRKPVSNQDLLAYVEFLHSPQKQNQMPRMMA